MNKPVRENQKKKNVPGVLKDLFRRYDKGLRREFKIKDDEEIELEISITLKIKNYG